MRSPFTLEALADWLERQPPEKEYDWFDCANCALGQYARSLGLTYEELPLTFRYDGNGVTTSLDLLEEVETFGKAAARARKVLRWGA